MTPTEGFLVTVFALLRSPEVYPQQAATLTHLKTKKTRTFYDESLKENTTRAKVTNGAPVSAPLQGFSPSPRKTCF